MNRGLSDITVNTGGESLERLIWTLNLGADVITLTNLLRLRDGRDASAKPEASHKRTFILGTED